MRQFEMRRRNLSWRPAACHRIGRPFDGSSSGRGQGCENPRQCPPPAGRGRGTAGDRRRGSRQGLCPDEQQQLRRSRAQRNAYPAGAANGTPDRQLHRRPGRNPGAGPRPDGLRPARGFAQDGRRGAHRLRHDRRSGNESSSAARAERLSRCSWNMAWCPFRAAALHGQSPPARAWISTARVLHPANRRAGARRGFARPMRASG